MLMEKERALVVEYGKKLLTEGLTTGTGGNISICDRKNRMFCIGPSGIPYFETQPEDVVVLDFEGNVIEGTKKPSSEYNMHMQVYLNYEQANSVVHCHSTFATVWSTNRKDLPASNYICASAGGNSIRCAEYATFGTKALAETTVKALDGRRACLQANHGQLAYGETIAEAFELAATVEQLCKIHVLASACGTPVILDDEEMKNMVIRFGSYGQPRNK